MPTSTSPLLLSGAPHGGAANGSMPGTADFSILPESFHPPADAMQVDVSPLPHHPPSHHHHLSAGLDSDSGPSGVDVGGGVGGVGGDANGLLLTHNTGNSTMPHVSPNNTNTATTPTPSTALLNSAVAMDTSSTPPPALAITLHDTLCAAHDAMFALDLFNAAVRESAMAQGLHACAANNAVHLVTAAGTLHIAIASALRHPSAAYGVGHFDNANGIDNSEYDPVDRIASICILALQMLFRAHHRGMLLVCWCWCWR